jgi:hypothetical protein
MRSEEPRRILREAGVPTIEVHNMNYRTEVRSFGRSRQVEDLKFWGRGWLVGSYLWSHTESRGELTTHRETFLTVLADEDDLNREKHRNYCLFPVYRNDQRNCYMLSYFSDFSGNPSAVATRVRELTGKFF